MRISTKTAMLIALAATTGSIVLAPPASAEIGSVFGGSVGCTVEDDGVRFCGSTSPRSTTPAWDGVPIDVNVAFPPAPAYGPDGNYPLVMIFHGYGGGKIGLSGMRRWLDGGYAAFSMTDRGFRESCGSAASQAADPEGCANGYVRLLDTRYEVRDAQEFAGQLADEGVIDPRRIGAIGGSYGGGLSMALAALKDRVMLPDGSLVRWRSPAGTKLRIAAAAPSIPWTDLAYSLAPNGGTLDYAARSPYGGRYGVMKRSLVNGLYLSGQIAPGYYAPLGTPGADVTGWLQRLEAGEPYEDAQAQAILDEVTSHHSSYYIPPNQRPAPLVISSGFTDDLFPADEAIRYYNRTRTKYRKAHIALLFGDFGHPRAQNKPDAAQQLLALENAWFDHFLRDVGKRPFEGVEAMTQTCPADAPSGGPFFARNWARISPGEVRLHGGGAVTIAPESGDPAIAGAFDPVTGGGACAQTSGADESGTANYRLGPAPPGGYTLMGSPTVLAKFSFPGDTSQVAARLLDVAPDGQQTLVARGLWRPATEGGGKAALAKGEAATEVFQLHPNGWHFAEGHVAKLQLLAKDAVGGPLDSYGRPSNDQQPVVVSGLRLRLPVLERPGALGGLVKSPAPKLVPEGYRLARDFKRLQR